MRINHIFVAALAVFSVGSVSAAQPAVAGEWRLHAARCPDLVEDVRDRQESRRDERYDHGRLDRIEDRVDRHESRRDERVTYCPASAWVWHGRGKPSRSPAAKAIYYDAGKRQYFRYGQRQSRIRVVVR